MSSDACIATCPVVDLVATLLSAAAAGPNSCSSAGDLVILAAELATLLDS